MPLPLVAVVVPQETPAPAAEALIRACEQAYSEGDCSLEDAPHEPNRILARIRWITPTVAEITLGLSHWNNTRSVQRQLSFAADDVELERNRSVGFALGTLAGTVAEVTRLEQEAQAAEVAKAQANAPAAESSNQETPAPAKTAPKTIAPRPNGVSHATTSRASGGPSNWVIGYSIGALLGTGFEAPRYGGSVGFRGVYAQRLPISLMADYAFEPRTEAALDPTYLRFMALFGLRTPFDALTADWLIGFVREYDHVSHSPTQSSSSRWTWGPTIAVQVRLRNLTLGPWLGISGSWAKPLDVFIEGQRSTLDRSNVFITLGVSIEN